mmetsp:Transcript_29246/g.49367  ORF Transcript_29246/g.49367 Transcript_29246/m.49367 type:complete len:128 (-) Transcript_29246:1558-1941(-)
MHETLCFGKKDSNAITFFRDMPGDIIGKVKELIAQWGGNRVLVMEDSSHITETVEENLHHYAPLVTPGSYFIVQDTTMRRLGHNTADPLRATERFLASEEGKDFDVDRSFEYYHCTQHANGFLRRNF